MFILDFNTPKTIEWKEAGITVDIKPLTTDFNDKFIRETTKQEFKEGEVKDFKRDMIKYAELVGVHCVKGWSGVMLKDGSEAEFNAENVKLAMKNTDFENFVFKQALALTNVIKQEVDNAKKD
jgi:hypothetical protein